MTLAFPHPILQEEVQARVVGVRIDGVPPDRDISDAGFRLISLYLAQRSAWSSAELDVELDAEPDDLAAFGEVSAVVVAFCRETNARLGTRVGGFDENGKATATVTLPRQGFRGKTELYAVLGAADESGLASWIGESDRWRLYFDEPDVLPIEGMLRVKWARFSDDEAVPPQAHKESFYVAIDAEPPIIYLNAEFDRLSDLLSDDESRPPAEKALRNAEFRRIASAAWSEMFTAAVAEVEIDDEGIAGWPRTDWKRQVMKGLLPDLYPDISDPVEALGVLKGDLAEGGTQILGLLQIAIAKQIGASATLRRDIKRVDS
jgi:hypothetical protein